MFPSLHVFYFGVFWVDSILNMIWCFGQKLKALKRDVPAECLEVAVWGPKQETDMSFSSAMLVWYSLVIFPYVFSKV